MLTVPSGAVVELHTKEVCDGQITDSTAVDDLPNIDFGLIHALTRPIYMEGATPGDAHAVTIHEVEVSRWGWATILPGFGFLADEFTEPWIRGFPMEPGATEVRFNDDITLPLAPFAGVLGVAPATDSMLVTIPPRTNGGNMDNRHMTAETTVYLPVQVDGALFSIGDTHAAQGDGRGLRHRHRGPDADRPHARGDREHPRHGRAPVRSGSREPRLGGRAGPLIRRARHRLRCEFV